MIPMAIGSGLVDDKGNIVWNDVLVALFAMDVLSEHPGATIMYNTLCSKVVEETIIKYGGKPFMWRVGHSFLKKKNQEVKAAFIGELSGHFFFSADFYNHDDGLYSTTAFVKLFGKNQSIAFRCHRFTSQIYIKSGNKNILSQTKRKLN